MTVRPLQPRDTPPAFCQYALGACDQDFGGVESSDVLFLYASQPAEIADSIERAAARLSDMQPGLSVRTWRDLPVEGQLIFTEICKAIRFATTVVADITTLNFNLLFEIGFCLGLDVPVLLIRDTTYLRDARIFDELGVFDTIGYIDFANGTELAAKLQVALPGKALPRPPAKTYTESPVYFLKGPVNTDGAIKLMSTLKKSRLRFRAYDPEESARLTLHNARRNVSGSYGLVANLLDPNRDGATRHNAICALLCGMATAEQKVVAMLQPTEQKQPIDYRDIVQTYRSSDQIPDLLEEPIREIVEAMQGPTVALPSSAAGLLETVDLGDTAAENEIQGLREYFVRTGQFRHALRGHARLVVGRKGTGKTAIFYEIRDAISAGHSVLTLDLKPDGHQFTKLREAVLEALPLGKREHLLTAFWNYILLSELAHKVLTKEYGHSQRDPQRAERYKLLEEAFLEHALASADDLSQRLLHQVDRLVERFGDPDLITSRDDVTEHIYGGDIKKLDDAVSEYLFEKDAVWLLIDNLDKSWATRGSTPTDILILRSLLEATRKLQRQLEGRDVEFNCLVFLRTDIYDHLVRETPDRDKDTPVRLDWDDPDVFAEIVRRRIEASTGMRGSFEELWRHLFESHVGAEESFRYMVDRTLMRPRDLLTFLQRAIEVAINRGHPMVRADDIRHAEAGFSEDMLLLVTYEIGDTRPELAEAVYQFHGRGPTLSADEVKDCLSQFGLDDVDDAIEILLWFGFLGAIDNRTDEERYAHTVRFNLRQLTYAIQQGEARYVIHPAFRAALGEKSASEALF